MRVAVLDPVLLGVLVALRDGVGVPVLDRVLLGVLVRVPVPLGVRVLVGV